MSAAERGIRMAAATLPAPMRERYREQWLADVRDAGELGLSRLAIVAGALAFSIQLGRTAELRGYTMTELMLRRLRWGMALVLCVPVVLVTMWVTGIASRSFDNLAIAAAVTVLGVVTVIVLCVGLGLLIAAARSANGLALAGALLSAAALLIVCAPLAPGLSMPSGYWVGGFTVMLALLALVVGALLALIGFTRGLAHVQMPAQAERAPTSSARRARAGMLAFLALLLLLGFGLFETLVLSPEQMAPDYTLAEIYALLSPADRRYGIAMAVVWLVFWTLAATVLLVLCLLRGSLARALNVLFTPRRLLVYALLLGSVIVFFQGWSGFSLGMSISDTVPPMAGGRSWQGQLLTLGGTLLFIAGLLLALVPGPRRAALPASAVAARTA